MKFERYFIVFLILAAVGGLSFFVPPFYAAFLIPAASFGVLLLGNPRLFIYTYLGVMGVYPLLKTIIPIAPVKYLNELMVLLLLCLFLGNLAFRRFDFRAIKKWKFGFGLMVGYALLTWLLNRGGLKATAQGLFLYFSFIPLYILSVKFLTRRDLKVMLFGSIGFFWVNFALNFGWWLGINPLYNAPLANAAYGSGILDASQGTLGTCTFVAYFCMMLFFILLTFRIKGMDVLGRCHRAIIDATIIAIFFQLYITYTNHAYIYFALAFIPYAVVSGLWKKWQTYAGVLAVAVVVMITLSTSEQWKAQFSQENIRDRRERLVHGAKVQLFNDLMVKNRRNYPYEWMFGVGPGNGMGTVGADNRTSFAYKMLLPYYTSTDMQGGLQMSSVTGSTQSVILTIWGDFGVVGFIIFLMIYIRVFMQALCLSLSEATETQCLAKGMIGALTILFLASIMIDTMQVSFLTDWVWVLAALLSLPEEESKKMMV